MKINGLIPAAGLSGRMGDFKPLMALDGRTLIENCIDSILLAGAGSVTVVLGYRGHEVASLIRNRYPSDKVGLAYNDNYADTDMLASVKIGISALLPCDAFFLLPGDMPAIDSRTFQAVAGLMADSGAMLAFPVVDGQRRHPALISFRFIANILEFKGDGGLEAVWNQYEEEIATIPVEDIGCEIDMDTMEDYNGLQKYLEEKRALLQMPLE